MSDPGPANPSQGFFARLLGLVAAPAKPADPAAVAVIAPELPGEVFFASEPEKDAAVAKSDGA